MCIAEAAKSTLEKTLENNLTMSRAVTFKQLSGKGDDDITVFKFIYSAYIYHTLIDFRDKLLHVEFTKCEMLIENSLIIVKAFLHSM